MKSKREKIFINSIYDLYFLNHGNEFLGCKSLTHYNELNNIIPIPRETAFIILSRKKIGSYYSNRENSEHFIENGLTVTEYEEEFYFILKDKVEVFYNKDTKKKDIKFLEFNYYIPNVSDRYKLFDTFEDMDKCIKELVKFFENNDFVSIYDIDNPIILNRDMKVNEGKKKLVKQLKK